MRRDALSRYLRGLAIAAVPVLGLTGCPIFPGNCGSDVTVSRPFDETGDGGEPALAQAVDDAGDLTDAGCAKLCNEDYSFYQVHSCHLESVDGGRGSVSCYVHEVCVGGRRPAGLAAARPRGGALGRWFGEMAHLEAASVVAFERLAEELALHGAPKALELQARAAARDEVRHARIVGALAWRFGGAPAPAVVAQVAPRGLEEIAIENAAEGCVAETWGALVALHQSRAASDGRVRAALARIADDEAEHAELAWRIDAWAARRLDLATRRRVLAARVEAARSLGVALGSALDEPLHAVAGLPRPAAARALHADLTRRLWAA